MAHQTGSVRWQLVVLPAERDDPVRDRKAGHACDAVGMETGAGDEVLPANDLPGGLDRNRVRFFDDRPSLGAKEDNASIRSEEHTSELQSLMRISYAVFCLKNNITQSQ